MVKFFTIFSVNLFQCILIVHSRNILVNKQKLFSVMGYSKNSILAFDVDIEGQRQIRKFLHLQIQSPNYAPEFQKIYKENAIFKTDIDLLSLWLPNGN